MRYVLITCMVLGVATGVVIAMGGRDTGPPRYQRAEAVVRELPSSRTFRRGGEWREGFVAVAELRDGSDRVEVAVERTTRPGDTTPVWVDTTTGRIWATVDAGDSPQGVSTGDRVILGVLGGALGGAVLSALVFLALDRLSCGYSAPARRLSAALDYRP